ncbi:hypothetical protein FACS1894158_05190 [Betaproteobacteria bacterium]|nr:hypothetical protein FACS1894158_05190 [Betaproteobacteria bacterium]
MLRDLNFMGNPIMAEKKTACNVIPCNHDDDSFVFVSYAHQDTGAVFPIIERVAAGGYAIWYDKGISISSTWTDEIAIAIMKCKAFLLFASKSAVNSSYVRAEIEFALNHKIKVIPVYLDGIDVLPPGLALGLNATQGITDIDTPQFVANQICNALIYNKVRRKDGQDASYAPLETAPEAPKRPWLKYLAAGALAAGIILAAVLFALPEHLTGKTLALEKSTFVPVEPIFLTLSKLSPEMIAKGVIITLSSADAAHGKYIARRFIEPNDIDAANPQAPVRVKLHAPEKDGRYEIRLYDDDRHMSPASLIGAAGFAVQGNSHNAFSVVLEKKIYAPDEDINIEVSGVPKRMIEDGALVGLFSKNPKRGDFIVYESTRDRDQRMSFYAPSKPGEYEFQAHINKQILDTPTLVVRIPFTVLKQAAEDAQ